MKVHVKIDWKLKTTMCISYQTKTYENNMYLYKICCNKDECRIAFETSTFNFREYCANSSNDICIQFKIWSK
jgi:hypothetical protein